MAISWTPTAKDFETLASWGLDKNPFAAIEDYSDLKRELRWLNPEHRQCHDAYIARRLHYVEHTKNFDHYYKTAQKPVDRLRWEYMMTRKAWFIMPLGWDQFAEGGRLIDVGCGDGDVLQRVIRHVERIWKEQGIGDRKLHIVGIDLNASRIQNAKDLVTAANPNITFEFNTANVVEGTRFPDRHFDYSLCTGVIEVVDPGEPVRKFVDELCRITKKGLYSEELMDEYPGGYPRRDLPQWLAERGFRTLKVHSIFTEPFNLHKVADPMKLWPIQWDQNLYAERFR